MSQWSSTEELVVEADVDLTSPASQKPQEVGRVGTLHHFYIFVYIFITFYNIVSHVYSICVALYIMLIECCVRSY